MSDKYGFKKAFLAMAGVQALTLSVYDRLAASKLTFALGTMSVYFTLGGACVCMCVRARQALLLTLHQEEEKTKGPPTRRIPSTFVHHPPFITPGAFAMFPPFIAKRFGTRNGVAIYSYIFTAFALASILGCGFCVIKFCASSESLRPNPLHSRIHTYTHTATAPSSPSSSWPTSGGYENVFKVFAGTTAGALGLAALLPDN